MAEQRHSRIAEARRRALDAKQKLALGALAGFVALVGLAWTSHPGKSKGSTSSSAQSLTPEQELFGGNDAFAQNGFERSDDFGGFEGFGSIAPSGGSAPQAQSRVS